MIAVEYDPAGLVVQLTDGAGVILPWIAAGVSGALVLLFSYMGIAKAFWFFRRLVEDRKFDYDSEPDGWK